MEKVKKNTKVSVMEGCNSSIKGMSGELQYIHLIGECERYYYFPNNLGRAVPVLVFLLHIF